MKSLLVLHALTAEVSERRRQRRATKAQSSPYARSQGTDAKSDPPPEYKGRGATPEDTGHAWRSGIPTDTSAGLSTSTWHDLHLDEILSFAIPLRTLLGRQVAHARLRQFAGWKTDPHLGRLRDLLSQRDSRRTAIREILASSPPDLGRTLWSSLEPGSATPRWLHGIATTLAVLMLCALLVGVVQPLALVVAVVLAMANVFLGAAFTRDTSLAITSVKDVVHLLERFDRLSGIDGIGQTEAASRLGVAARRLQRVRRLARLAQRDALGDGEIGRSMLEYLNLLFLVDLNFLVRYRLLMRQEAVTLRAIAFWVGEVEIALAVHELTAGKDQWCVPDFRDEGPTRIERMWHPMLTRPIAIDVTLSADRGLAITGANMSGKSTLLRSLGVATVLAHCLDACPAESFTGPSVRPITMMSRSDDLARGVSYFRVEIDRLVELVMNPQGMNRLVLIDEPLTGTGTVDRLAIAEASLRRLVRTSGARANGRVVVTTHEQELVGALSDCFDALQLVRFTREDSREAMHLQPGVVSSSVALEIFRDAGADRELYEEALRLRERWAMRLHPVATIRP